MSGPIKVTLTTMPDFDATDVSDDDLLALQHACVLELKRRAALELDQ